VAIGPALGMVADIQISDIYASPDCLGGTGNAVQAEALAAGIGLDRAGAMRADVTDPGEVGAMFASARAAFGRPVTTVVNNALASFSFNGDARSGADAISWDEFAAQLEGSVKGALNTTQAALPGLREQGYGRIVNIGTNLFQNPVVPTTTTPRPRRRCSR